MITAKRLAVKTISGPRNAAKKTRSVTLFLGSVVTGKASSKLFVVSLHLYDMALKD